jgi:hypothetical protein
LRQILLESWGEGRVINYPKPSKGFERDFLKRRILILYDL